MRSERVRRGSVGHGRRTNAAQAAAPSEQHARQRAAQRSAAHPLPTGGEAFGTGKRVTRATWHGTTTQYARRQLAALPNLRVFTYRLSGTAAAHHTAPSCPTPRWACSESRASGADGGGVAPAQPAVRRLEPHVRQRQLELRLMQHLAQLRRRRGEAWPCQRRQHPARVRQVLWQSRACRAAFVRLVGEGRQGQAGACAHPAKGGRGARRRSAYRAVDEAIARAGARARGSAPTALQGAHCPTALAFACCVPRSPPAALNARVLRAGY